MSLVLDRIGYARGEEIHIADASLDLRPGSMDVLLGPTLSGKTTLMRLVAGLGRPTSGHPIEDGRDVTGVGVKRRSVAMVYQQVVDLPTLTACENIASPLRVEGLGKAGIEPRVARAAELMRLGPPLKRTPAQLSGRQQRRTALARDQDAIMARIEKSGVQGKLGPKMNKEDPAEHWCAEAEKDGNLAPQRKLAEQRPQGETVEHDTLIRSWPSNPPKTA